MKPNSCPSKGNNPTALSAWLFSSICFTAHNHETLNRPFSAVLTDSVLIKTSLHMLRQLPRPITNDQLIIIAPLLLFFPSTSSPQTNLGRIPLRCQHICWLLHFRLKTAWNRIPKTLICVSVCFCYLPRSKWFSAFDPCVLIKVDAARQMLL